MQFHRDSIRDSLILNKNPFQQTLVSTKQLISRPHTAVSKSMQITNYSDNLRKQNLKGLRSKQNFSNYLVNLKQDQTKSHAQLQQFKQTIKDSMKPVIELQVKEEKQMIEYLVKQERNVKKLGAGEQEEFNRFKQKQLRILKIKNYVRKTEQLKTRLDLKDQVEEIKDHRLKMKNQEEHKYQEPKYMLERKQKIQKIQYYHSVNELPLPLDFLQLGNEELIGDQLNNIYDAFPII